MTDARDIVNTVRRQAILDRVIARLDGPKAFVGLNIVRAHSRFEWLVQSVQTWERLAMEIANCQGGFGDGFFDHMGPRPITIGMSLDEQHAWDEIDFALSEML